ncbi:hypothetical protein GCK72_023026 [Caenorhabditis remanei]|uniref:Uncharacterized protein n=1 Tax=Caenorhabditis remanei TaxID=31234 RepID=A0A6A5FVX1_CAERE|nr:hypothetical protein GCK72_023026 [Caenorhabditis remanei]KAF1746569.1 hypothetical protein GCK72_023026 [Caenorhabditis remanei]
MAKDPKRNKNRETKTVCKAVIKKINTVKEKERNARQEAENARLAQLNAPRELTKGMKQRTTDPVTEVYDSITKLKEWRRSLLSPVNQSKDLGSGCSSTDLASSPNELDNNSPCNKLAFLVVEKLHYNRTSQNINVPTETNSVLFTFLAFFCTRSSCLLF